MSPELVLFSRTFKFRTSLGTSVFAPYLLIKEIGLFEKKKWGIEIENF